MGLSILRHNRRHKEPQSHSLSCPAVRASVLRSHLLSRRGRWLAHGRREGKNSPTFIIFYWRIICVAVSAREFIDFR